MLFTLKTFITFRTSYYPCAFNRGHSVSYWVGVYCWHCETLTLFKRVIRKIWYPVQEYSFGTLFKTGPKMSVEFFEHYAMLQHVLNVLMRTGSCNPTRDDTAGSQGNKYPVQDTNTRIVYPVWDRDPWKLPYPGAHPRIANIGENPPPPLPPRGYPGKLAIWFFPVSHYSQSSPAMCQYALQGCSVHLTYHIIPLSL